MGKLFTGKAKFGFAFNQTGAQPLDDRSVVQSYNDLLNADTFGSAIYNGMIVATVDEEKVYMLVDKTKVTSASGWKEVGDGKGSLSVANFNIVDGEIKDATNDNIGQIIYITEGTEAYPKGPYIVTGVGAVSKLGIISGNGDIASIASDVELLKGDVTNLQKRDNELAGLIDGVEDKADLNKGAIDKLNSDVYDENGALSLVKSGTVYTTGEIDTKLSDYVTTASYNEFVGSTATNFANIDIKYNGLKDTYATITSVSAIATSVQELSDAVDTKAAQSDLVGAVGRIESLETAVNTTIPKDYATKTELQGLSDKVDHLPEYTITKSATAEDGYAASYKLMVGDKQVGATINVLKDTVVESGEVRKLYPDELDKVVDADTDAEYIVLTIANKTDDKLYIKASSLVDAYTAGSYITISDTKVVSVNIDSVYGYIETEMLKKETFATHTEVGDAQLAAEANAARYTDNAAGKAYTDATGYTDTKLANYTTTSDLAKTYATKDALQGQRDEIEDLIEDGDEALDLRIQLLEEQLGLGNTGNGDKPSVSQQLADALVDVSNLKDAVGKKASTDDEGNPVKATGIYADITDLDVKLTGQISGLSDTVVKKISLNGTELTPVSGTITIDVVNEIKEEGNTGTSLISLSAAKTYVDSKVTTISSSINALKTEKASIKLVAADYEATATNVIYLVGDAKAPKVVIDGALHTLGSNLYASIDKYASATEGGLMSKEGFSKLDEIGALDTDTIIAKIDEINNTPSV
jgi:hypothetical protein